MNHKNYSGHRIKVLHVLTNQRMGQIMAELDLTPAQAFLLRFFTQNPGARSRDAETYLSLTHPTVCGILSRLEEKGFIRTQADSQDRRCKRSFPTPQGLNAQADVERGIQAVEEQMVAGFSLEEREIFSDLLQRAIQNLGGTDAIRNWEEAKA